MTYMGKKNNSKWMQSG